MANERPYWSIPLPLLKEQNPFKWLKESEPYCPVCLNLGLELGESVDIGVGSQQVSPDYCPFCGYVQKGADDSIPDLETYLKAWELQCQLTL